MKFSPKIGNSTTPDSEMLYDLFNNLLLGGTRIWDIFEKSSFSQKRQYPLDEFSEFNKNSSNTKP
jgi:hypothetical protein